MATLKTIEYVCVICGSEISVTGDGSGHLSPIYCCGVNVSLQDIGEEERKVDKKGTVKAVKKTVIKKKKTNKSVKKTTSKKQSKKAKK